MRAFFRAVSRLLLKEKLVRSSVRGEMSQGGLRTPNRDMERLYETSQSLQDSLGWGLAVRHCRETIFGHAW